jgi:hypothetical protein
MIELNTGYLDFEQLDDEVVAIAEDFHAFGIDTVYVTFGIFCQCDNLAQSEDVSVPTSQLVRFIATCEVDGTFELGESNLYIEGGGLKFLLCHERDIHCSGEESPSLMAVRRRWAREYRHSCERRSGGQWHRLTGRPKDSRNA